MMLMTAAQLLPAQSDQKFYYWLAPGDEPNTAYGRDRGVEEGFVVEVNAEVAQQIDSGRANGYPMGVAGTVAAGATEYNRNYFLPAHPQWNWHFAVVEYAHRIDAFFGADDDPRVAARPSDIAKDLPSWNGRRYEPQFYEVKGRINPAQADAVANVSNRAAIGAGERAPISGFIVTGGQPRNLVLRVLGPSLSAAGVQQPASDPRFELYRGNTLVARNDDWRSDLRAQSLQNKYPTLAPTNDKEAAMLITLLPGAYTIRGLTNGAAGEVVLMEAYDVDISTSSN